MKILHIITRSQWGGAQKIVFELAKRQTAAGHDVAVMCGERGRLNQYLREEGIEIKENLYLKRVPGLADAFALYKIWQETHEGYDLVHAHSTKAGMLSRVLKVRRTLPVCFTVHGFGITSEHPIWQQFIYHRLERFLAPFADALVFVNSADRKKAEEKLWLRRMPRIAVIPNGVSQLTGQGSMAGSQAGLTLRQSLDIPTDGFVIGNLARVVWVKNPEFWLRTAEAYIQENPKAYFVWFGEGPELATMRKKIAGLRSSVRSHVIFPGEVENISEALENMDVLFLSSRSEGMPLAVLEGMLKKRAVLAPALPGLREILGERTEGEEGEGPAGILYEPGNLAGILDLLGKLEDSLVRGNLGKVAYNRVQREFSAEQMAQAYENLYTLVCNSSMRPLTHRLVVRRLLPGLRRSSSR